MIENSPVTAGPAPARPPHPGGGRAGEAPGPVVGGGEGAPRGGRGRARGAGPRAGVGPRVGEGRGAGGRRAARARGDGGRPPPAAARAPTACPGASGGTTPPD